ncbi:FAD-dependent oxidoreductase [Roseovarius spongiae]|uniref:FAD-dependent oxidoreductase n=1 Tax=Roseovarius spongiae TaxID=2320272 RepID=A0A3A8B054_9RHOB|nr:FAD-dependent oxidoreductase [Roseovarius spongiae]RKF16770.1 FAD-dependent oxidoreductase [Roseovarius spongiae]
MGATLIIGGGAIGLSVAYHLGRRGASGVTLLERNTLTSGTSWHAAGIVGPLRATAGMTRLAAHALDLFPRLEAETGMATGYRRTGGYWLAREPARLDELRRICSLGRAQGMRPRMIGAEEVAVPGLALSDHVGALLVPEDGNVNPVDLCMAYARAARSAGVTIREGARVERLLTRGDRIRGAALADGTEIAADRVILCTGAWSRELAATAGVALPLQAVEHMYVVTTPIHDLPDPFPVIRDLDRGIYIKGDAGKLVIGGFEPDAKPWDAHGPEGDRAFLEMAEDWDQFAPFMEAALALMPSLADAGIQHFMNGPESFTADTRPYVGETPQVDGLFVAAGMNSVGVMSSAGIGRALADWAADGAAPSDLWEVDVARADPRAAAPAHMAERMKEAVADLFALHWPYKQPVAGRGLRCSALHDRWAAAGAVFGVTGGWERGLWYARSADERALPYSTGAQPWQPIAAREAAVMTQGTALLDLSPFTKLRMSGPGALAGLNALATAQMDVATGRAVYCQMLNPHGGIEMDVTVTRAGAEVFDITSGAATRWRDAAWLRRNLPNGCTLEDRTEAFCVIGVMGAGSRALLRGLAEEWPDMAFAHAAEVTLAGAPCRATRVSFVGALGWEITVATRDAPAVFDALLAAGGRPMGHYALESCRIEKGFRAWGHDLGPEITPLEAGLGFTIDWNKDFQGKAALAAQREAGATRRLVLLRMEGNPLMLHDEPVFEGDRLVGLTTSGGVGARTGLTLAFALVDTAPGETLAQTCARAFAVEVAGERRAATALRRAPYDPEGKEMRG